MKEEIKQVLERYDQLVGLILDQKIDEFADKMDERPPEEDDVTYETYLQRVAMQETEEQSRIMEQEPNDLLGGKSMNEYFAELPFDELKEILEYSALELDRGVPDSIVNAVAGKKDRKEVITYAEQIVKDLKASPLLNSTSSTHTHAIIVGILAGNDLRLTEVGHISNELQFNFAANAELSLGTVNDEETFSGRLTAVVLLFDTGNRTTVKPNAVAGRFHGGITNGPQGRGRFHNSEKTIWNGMDLDIPTYLRQNITLDR